MDVGFMNVVVGSVSVVKFKDDVKVVDERVGAFVESVRVTWMVVVMNCVVSVADSEVPKDF